MKRTAASFSSTLQLLEQLIQHASGSTTRLIVCSTKDNYLSQLITPLLEARKLAIPEETLSSQDETIEIVPDEKPQLPHALLTPAIKLLAATKAVKLAFCPSISTLRAYLAGHDFREATIILLGLIQLHHSTSEFSAQGLSRTLAGAVSAGARVKATQVRLVECGDILDPSNPHRGGRIWDAQVPLLSSSVRIGGDGAAWAGRTINVNRIVSRWFEFEHDDHESAGGPGLESDEERCGNEEMFV